MLDQLKEEDFQTPVSASFDLENARNSNVKIQHKYTLGDTDMQTFSVRYDPNDKYIAAGCGDGCVRIYNTFTSKLSFVLSQNLAEPTPVTCVRWRPLQAPGVTKNVILTVTSSGYLQHWHTTSGKLLHTIYDELNPLLTADFNPDGTLFATTGNDCHIRVYDEQTRKLKIDFDGGEGT